MEHIYLDNAATTKIAPEVIEEMTKQMTNQYGNASSTHYFGRQSHTVLDNSRQILADSINAQPSEILITSGATESNNMAIIQTALKRQNEGKRIITTAIEHPSVLEPMRYLDKQGFDIVYLPVNENGQINFEDLKTALTSETILVSIMYGNNEVGSQMPITKIGEYVHENSAAWFHTDATQAYGLVDIDVNLQQIDLLSVSAHKINGPKQIGFLYLKTGVYLPALILGGHQESMRRAGTENIPAIAGFAKAVSLMTSKGKQQLTQRYQGFKKQICLALEENQIAFEINAEKADAKLEHVFNLWIKEMPTDILQMNLDLAGFSISGGSACTAGSLEPSHVLMAMYGKENQRVNQSIRISFGHSTTPQEITAFSEALVKIVHKKLG